MTDETAPPAPPRHVGERPRVKTIPLAYPLEYGGKIYDAISLARLTVAEVESFQEKLAAAVKENPDATIRFPLFRDADGALVPDAVMDALDDDDKYELDKAAEDFLPRRFRGVTPSA